MKFHSKADGAKARLHFVNGRASAWVDPEDIVIPPSGNFIQTLDGDVVTLQVSVFYVAFIEYATKIEFEKVSKQEAEAREAAKKLKGKEV